MDQAVLRRRMAKCEMPPKVASATVAGSGTHLSAKADVAFAGADAVSATAGGASAKVGVVSAGAKMALVRAKTSKNRNFTVFTRADVRKTMVFGIREKL